MLSMFLPLVSVLVVGAGDELPSLEREYLRVAQEVVKHCQDKGYANVGVLKFRITKDSKTFNDNVGTLNLTLAQRLEVALVLANKPRNPLGILDNPTATAHRTPGANHLTDAGRSKLFEPVYPLAWGHKNVKPDAFITGLASVSPDLKTMQIQLLLFDGVDPENKLRRLIATFQVAIQPEQLVEIGESFNKRILADGDKGPPAKQKAMLIQAAAQLKDQSYQGTQPPPPNPACDPKAPVALEIRYDDRAVPIEVRSGKAFAPEPRKGQKVEFVLRRDAVAERYGVVLKVNGENTISKQRLPDLQCRRWVLDPGDKPIVVRGYQITNTEIERFRVLSARESKAREMDYGADVGTITLSVFGEKGPKQSVDLSDAAREAAVVSKGSLQTQPREGEPEKPDTFNALTARLLDDANRGLIGEGAKELGVVRTVKFDADPLPIMSLTIVYYQLQVSPK